MSAKWRYAALPIRGPQPRRGEAGRASALTQAARLAAAVLATAALIAPALLASPSAHASSALSVGPRVQKEFFTPIQVQTQALSTCFTTDANGNMVMGFCAAKPLQAPQSPQAGDAPTRIPASSSNSASGSTSGTP